MVTIKKESVDAQIYKFVLRGKHLRARLISSPHLRYIFLRRGGWTDRSMVQSRLSGHGGRVLAAPRRLRLAFPDSVRRRPDAATVGRSARSGHQSASSEPANLSLSLSLALSRARRGARARAAASSRHTRTSTHRNTCRAHACPPESAHMHTAFPLAPSHPAERPSSSRGDPARRGLHPAHDARGSPSSWPSLAAAVRSQTSTRQARGVRTYARTHARNTTDHVQGPRGSFLLFSRPTARSIRSKDTRRRIFGAVHFVLLSLPALPPFFATASNTLYGIHRSDLVFLASVHPTSLVERRRGTRSLEFPARVTAATACACAPFRGDSFREDRACDGDGPRDGKSCTHGASARASSPWWKGKGCGELLTVEDHRWRERLPPMGDDSKGNERRTPGRMEKVAAWRAEGRDIPRPDFATRVREGGKLMTVAAGGVRLFPYWTLADQLTVCFFSFFFSKGGGDTLPCARRTRGGGSRTEQPGVREWVLLILACETKGRGVKGTQSCKYNRVRTMGRGRRLWSLGRRRVSLGWDLLFSPPSPFLSSPLLPPFFVLPPSSHFLVAPYTLMDNNSTNELNSYNNE